LVFRNSSPVQIRAAILETVDAASLFPFETCGISVLDGTGFSEVEGCLPGCENVARQLVTVSIEDGLPA
jgi:hypothetical protein